MRNSWILDIFWRSNQYDLLIRSDVACERGAKDASKVLGLSNKKMELLSTEIGMIVRKASWGYRLLQFYTWKFGMPVRHSGWIDTKPGIKGKGLD